MLSLCGLCKSDIIAACSTATGGTQFTKKSAIVRSARPKNMLYCMVAAVEALGWQCSHSVGNSIVMSPSVFARAMFLDYRRLTEVCKVITRS